MRWISFLEVVSGAGIAFGYFWFVYPTASLWGHASCMLLFAGLLAASRRIHGESRQDSGLRLDNFREAAKILAWFTLAGGAAMAWIWSAQFPIARDFWQKPSFWIALGTYPAWALLQQYIMLAFFFRRLREVFSPWNGAAMLASAAIFSALHIPNLPLTALCFPAGLLWAWVYHRHPNLFATILSHAAWGVLCIHVLGVYGKVGPYADFGRWSRHDNPVLYSIDAVNGRRVSRNSSLSVKRGTPIEVSGWALGARRELERIAIDLDWAEHEAFYGSERDDVAKHWNRPEARFCGFRASIPTAGLESGWHVLVLKVSLRGKNYWHRPGERIWIHLE